MRSSVAFAVLGACACGGTAVAATPQVTLADLCVAEGGAHWRNVAALSATGSDRSLGMQGTYASLTDLRNGDVRHQERFPILAQADGIDAHGAWSQDRSGQIHGLDSPEADAIAVTRRWLNRRGYCHPTAQRAALQAVAPATADRVAYMRVEATPPHGRAVTLWIDPVSHRLARTMLRSSGVATTTAYADYHEVDGLELPFRITRGLGKFSTPATVTITRYRVLHALQSDVLKRPSDAVTDARIADGAPLAAVPFRFGNGKLLIEARIDGKGPFPFILDTGGHAIMTPQTAAQLGLKPVGSSRTFGAGAGSTPERYTRVRSVRLGNAEIDNQSFAVIPQPPIETDLGDHPPIAGILGLGLFERFAVTLDFAKYQMLLRPFATFAPPPGSTRVPIYFTQDEPLVYAKLDGKRGLFGLDTGNSGPLVLFPQWAQREGLAPYYLTGMPSQEGGEGGMFTTHTAWIRSLQVGGLNVPADEPGELAPLHSGAFSNPSQAGNLGLPVWRHFDVTFDYPRGYLYLVPRTDFTLPTMTAWPGFMAAKFDHAAFTVVQLLPGGAAAKAGLKQGDKIVRFNGIAATELPSLWMPHYLNHARAGERLHFTLEGGRKMAVTLVPDTMLQKALHPSGRI